jgi:predicted DCC family thiol-disulfide oxidoreductase YuxK
VGPRVEQAVVLIDGECGLCNRASHYGMRHARKGLLRFVAIQSDEGQALLRPHGLQETAEDTMVAVVGPRAYLRSAAVVQVARRLKWPYRAQAALWLVPKPLRDAGYDWVARRRRKWQ